MSTSRRVVDDNEVVVEDEVGHGRTGRETCAGVEHCPTGVLDVVLYVSHFHCFGVIVLQAYCSGRCNCYALGMCLSPDRCLTCVEYYTRLNLTLT